MKKLTHTQLGRFVVGLIALLVVVGINLAAAQGSVALRADITDAHVMTPSATSTDTLKALPCDVQISYVATERDKELWVDELAARYAAASKCVTYRMIDPNGGEAEKLAAKVGSTLAEGTLVVTRDDQIVTISPDELYDVTYDETYLYYYGQQVPTSMFFRADELLLNAIEYLSDDSLPVVYALNGHGEQAITGELMRQFQQHCLQVTALNLGNAAVPEDAAAILLNKPTSDLTEEEASALLTYLKQGGKLILASNYTFEGLANLETVMAYYGMEVVENALILESDAKYRYSSDYPYYLKPDLATHDITAATTEAGESVLIPMAGALERNTITRAGLRVDALLNTSDTSYMKSGAAQVSTLDAEEGDPTGSFAVAMAASEGDTRVIWINGDALLGDILTHSSGNITLLDSLLRWMVPVKERTTLETENLVTPALTLPAQMRPLMYIAVFLPALLLLAVGLFRRHKMFG